MNREKSIINTNDLGHITQILKILKKLKSNHFLLQYAKVENLFNGLTFRLYFDDFDERRFFDLKISFIERIEMFRGAEVARRTGWEVLIFVNKFKIPKRLPKRIELLLRDEIEDRKKGLILETMFQKHVERLINQENCFSSFVSGVSASNEKEDWVYRIDRFLILKNGDSVPIQIKSSLWGRMAHKESGAQVPSLVYAIGMQDEVLKEKILQICRSYQLEPRLIEHL